MQTTQTNELEVIGAQSLQAIERATIDVQIATAHAYPRSVKQFLSRATELATMDEDTAASCVYCRPVGGGKNAEGMSIRLAEIVGASYGNLRVGAQIVEQTERYVKARGFAHDLETNFASSTEVIESTVKKDGSPYDERMRIVIAKACLAKARRDATFQVVPKAACKPVELAARKVAVGDAKSLDQRRAGVMKYLSTLGIDLSRVWAALKIQGEEEIGLDELATITGLRTAIKDGEVTIDEAFPKPSVDTQKPSFAKGETRPPTPLETLRRDMAVDGVSTEQLLGYIEAETSVKAGQLEEISADFLATLNKSWKTISAQIKGGAQ